MHAYTRLLTHAAIFAVLGIIASGCGDGSGKKYIFNTTYKVDPKPVDPTPPTPPTTPTDPAPIDSKTPSTPAATIRLDQTISSQGTGNSVFVAVLKLVALKDGVALRRLRVNTDKAVNRLEVYNYTDTTSIGLSTSSNVAPVTSFTIQSATRLDMGYLPLAGDSLYIQLLVDASNLDGKTVTFTVASVDVSAGNNAVETIADKLPAAFTVLFGEYPQMDGIAGITSRAAVRGTETVLAEFNLRNIGSHSVDLLSVRFNPAQDGLKDVKSLKIKVGTTFTSVFPTAQDGNYFNGRLIEVDTTMGNIVLPPGQSILVQLLGDTLTAGSKTEVWADFALVQIHGDPTRSVFAYEALDNGAMTLFTTTFVAQDNLVSALSGILPPYNGDSTKVLVMRLFVFNNDTTARTIRGVYARLIANKDLGNVPAWTVLKSTGATLDSRTTRVGLSTRFDNGTSVVIPAGGMVEIEMRINVDPSKATGVTVLYTIEGLETDRGLLPLSTTSGPSSTLG